MKLINIVLIATAAAVAAVLLNEMMRGANKTAPAAAIQGSVQPAAAKANVAGITSTNVYLENGVQIIEIRAKGGYSPLQTTAKAARQP